jgi:hypothetical protein
MIGIRKESAWKFVTSATGGAGVELFAAEGGCIYLQDPSGQNITFKFGGAGVGLSGRLEGAEDRKDHPSESAWEERRGRRGSRRLSERRHRYILESFSGQELSRSDLTGVCVFAEVGGGLVAGASATGMLLGVNPAWLVATAAMPMAAVYTEIELLKSAKAMLLMAGLNVGYQAGGGAAAFVGAVF